MPRPLPPEDLAYILTHATASFNQLKNSRLFITGGTGFFGHWLLESLLHANRELSLNARATVLTRSATAFHTRAPHITQNPAITLLEGDIQTFAFPSEPHTHILHAATDSTGAQAAITEAELAASIVAGTRRVLSFAGHTRASRLLYVSSGAVYGRNITDAAAIPESRPLPPTPDPPATYDEAKRLSESLCLALTTPSPVIARCFAFVGPHLPLDQHFAIGNFIRDALAGTPIHIRGDGTPLRSFLYMSDLAVWLWALLTHAAAHSTYNVGSDESVSIAELAHLTAATLHPGLPVQIDGTPTAGIAPATYVPDITQAATDLDLRPAISLTDAIHRTAAWHSNSPYVAK